MEAIHQMHLVSPLGLRSRVWGSGGYPAQEGGPIMIRHPAGPRETVASGALGLHERERHFCIRTLCSETLPHGTGSGDPAQRTGGCRSTADNRRPSLPAGAAGRGGKLDHSAGTWRQLVSSQQLTRRYLLPECRDCACQGTAKAGWPADRQQNTCSPRPIMAGNAGNAGNDQKMRRTWMQHCVHLSGRRGAAMSPRSG